MHASHVHGVVELHGQVIPVLVVRGHKDLDGARSLAPPGVAGKHHSVLTVADHVADLGLAFQRVDTYLKIDE